MRFATMIVPVWREFPGRVVRLAAAALIVTTALTVPKAAVTDSNSPTGRQAPVTATSGR